MNPELIIDPYKELNVIKKALEDLTEEEANAKIFKSKEMLITFCNTSIQYDKNPEKVEKMMGKINTLNYAYNLIKDTESRQNYEEKELMKQEKIKKILESKSLEKYVDETLIKTKDNGEKAVEEISKNSSDIFLEDYKGRNLRIREINQINYCDALGLTSTLYEYIVKRTINGITKRNRIFSDINIHDLSVNSNGKAINKEYYEMISNELLSEMNLFISKNVNNNYIGVVEKSNKGYYEISTETDSKNILNSQDRERLTVSSYLIRKRDKNHNKTENNNGNKNSQGEGR